MSSDRTWPGRELTLNSWHRNDRPPRRHLIQSHRGVVTAGHALWFIMAQLLDGRPLAIGQAAGFHSCGQVHRDLSAAPPRDRRVDRDEWKRFERRYVSTKGGRHCSYFRDA